MIVLIVTYKCKPGMNRQFLERINAEGIGAACRAEEGNIKYDYYLPTDGSDDLLLLEKWESPEALQKHSKQPHLAKLKEIKPEYVTDVALNRFES